MSTAILLIVNSVVFTQGSNISKTGVITAKAPYHHECGSTPLPQDQYSGIDQGVDSLCWEVVDSVISSCQIIELYLGSGNRSAGACSGGGGVTLL